MRSGRRGGLFRNASTWYTPRKGWAEQDRNERIV